MIEKLKNWRNRKPKSVRIAEAIFALLPDEEWERMKFPLPYQDEDVRVIILKIAQESTCVYSLKKSVELAQLCVEEWMQRKPWDARAEVVSFFMDRIFKNGRNRRTLESFFNWN